MIHTTSYNFLLIGAGLFNAVFAFEATRRGKKCLVVEKRNHIRAIYIVNPRSLGFEYELLDVGNYQGNAVVNYTELSVPFTRIIEHKYFEFGNQAKTVITREYPRKMLKGLEPYYPVNTEHNNKLLKKYRQLSKIDKNIFYGVGLGTYQYMDMDETVGKALSLFKQLFTNKESNEKINKKEFSKIV